MKVVILFGSPRKKGNTATAVGWLEEALAQAGHEVERIHLAAVKLNGCVSCFQCQTREDFGCAQKDEGNAIFGKVVEADAMVFASPVYWWSVSAQMKPLIDRLMSQVKGMPPKQRSNLEGKRTGVLMTCWGPIEDNTECVTEMWDRAADYLLLDYKGVLMLPGCAPQGPVSEDHRPQVEQLAGALVG